MIYKETILKNGENSGVIWSKCINVIKCGNKQVARLGDKVLISIFRTYSKKKLKNKKYIGLIISVKSFTKRLEVNQQNKSFYSEISSKGFLKKGSI